MKQLQRQQQQQNAQLSVQYSAQVKINHHLCALVLAVLCLISTACCSTAAGQQLTADPKPKPAPTVNPRAEGRKRIVALKSAYRIALIEALNVYAQQTENTQEAARAREHAKAIEELEYMSPLLLDDQQEPSQAGQTYHDAVADARELLHSGLLEMLKDNPNAVNAGPCTELMANLDESEDVELMGSCMDFYWHYQLLDWPPMSFSNVITLSKRYVELKPHEIEVYMDAVWLLWSRWVTWKNKPARRPIGKGGDKDALQLLLDGRERNMENGDYHYQAAKTMWGVAKYHDSAYFSFIIDSLTLADKYAGSDAERVDTCKLFGHTYRAMEKPKEAAVWYEKAHEIAPDDQVIIRLLGEMKKEQVKQPVAPK